MRSLRDPDLRRDDNRLCLMIDSLPALIAYCGCDNRIIFCNKTFERWLERPSAEIKGKTIDEAMGLEVFRSISPYIQEALAGLEVSLEGSLPGRDGTARSVRFNFAPHMGPEGRMRGYYMLVEDISKFKQDEEKLESALQERETLLAEVHHRVKNNMAVINSLLNLQIEKLSSDEAVSAIRDCQNRIRSMALIHETLYQDRDFSGLSLKSYVNNLSQFLMDTYKLSLNRRSLKLDLADVFLPARYMVPCGLILNEIIANSLEHAFPPGFEGEIRIAARKSDKGEVTIVVGDNGVGFPGDMDFRNCKSMGLQLVIKLVERQLKGSIEIREDQGVEFTIKFKVAPPQTASAFRRA